MDKQDVKKALRTTIEKEYYPDGTIKSEIPYLGSKKHGVERHYYEDGSIKSETPYVRGELNRSTTIFFNSGFLKSILKDIEGIYG